MKTRILTMCKLLVRASYLLVLLLSGYAYANPDPLLKQPLLFVENKGQVTNLENGIKMEGIDFTTGNAAVKLFIRRDGIHYQFTNPEGKQGNATLYRLDMYLLNANPNSILTKEGETEYTENFYGAIFPQGILNVHSFERIVYRDVYPNIDWVLYSNEGGMKYDFNVKPGGNVKDIKIRYSGASQLNLDNGAVLVTTPLGSVTENAPLVYQGMPANAVASSYNLANDVISFNVSEYNRNQVLVVDPVLLWGTYFGGDNNEVVRSVFVDGSDNMYATGYTYSAMGLGVSGHQNSYGGMADAFIVKYNSSGVKQWSTYYGGLSNDSGEQVKGDASGNIYLVGTTGSSSGIATTGSHQATKLGSPDYAFLAKFNGAGVRQWATYYGGSTGDTQANELAVSTDGIIYFGGETRSSLGIVTNGQPGSLDYKTYLAAFSSQGTRLWGRVLDQTDEEGRIGLVGLAQYGSSIYTTTNFNGALWKLNSSDGTTVFNNFIGYGLSEVTGLATDATGRVYICGNDNSTPKSFLEKFTTTGSREWRKDFGPTTNGIDICNSISISGISIYLSGSASNNGYATSNGNQPTKSTGSDAWVAKFNSDGDQEWGSYIGGSSDDFSSAVFAKPSYVVVGGSTRSGGGIATNGSSFAGGIGSDGFLVKFSSTCPSVAQAGAIAGTTTVCESSSRVFSIAAVPNATMYQWTVPSGSVITNGQGTTSITVTMGPSSGNISVTAKNSCSPGTAKTLAVVVNPVAAIPSVIVGPASVNTGTTSAYSVSSVAGVTYSWSAGSGGTVTGTDNSISISWSTGGTKTIGVTATNACGTSSSRTLSVNVTSCTIPSQPSVITKNSGFECSGSTASYSITTVAGVSYTWTVSTGGTISGSGSNATVTWNATTGARTITVTPSNSCGNGTGRTLAVTIGSAPIQPSIITGNTTVCTGVSTPYNVTNVAGVTYTWNTGGGGTITGSGNAINVIWTSAGAKTLTVTPSTLCGNGTPRTLAVTVNAVPSQPSVIAGSTTVATGSSNQFSVTNEAGVTYAWNAGTGGTVTGSGNSVTISWSSAGSKTITLTPSNSCGNGTARTLNVAVNDCAAPAQPSTITGSVTGCTSANGTYSVTSVGGVTYTWNAGTDGFVSGSGNSVTLSWTSVGVKTVTVTPSNACGNGVARTLAVTVSQLPAQPSVITGNITPCKNASLAYSVTNVAGVTYTWDVLGTGTITGSGNSINVTWTATGSHTLRVTPSNACGSGVARTLDVVVNDVPLAASQMAGLTNVCAGVSIPYSVGNLAGVTYTWSAGSGSTITGSTSAVSISWSTGGTKTVSVTPSNVCGNGIASTKTVEVSTTPAQPSTIVGSTAAVGGVSQSYSVTNVPGVTYVWTTNGDGVVSSTGNTALVTWSTAGTKTLTVTPSNLCGIGTARTLTVTTTVPCTIPGTPSSMTIGFGGSTTLALNDFRRFVVGASSGATSLNISVSPSAGTTITPVFGNTWDIVFTIPGTYTVSGFGEISGCGAGAPASITVSVCTGTVADPSAIVGTFTSVCRGTTTRYSVTPVPGVLFDWSLSSFSGTITPLNADRSIVDITWSTTFGGDGLTVRAKNACNVLSSTVSETIFSPPVPSAAGISLVSNGTCPGTGGLTWTIGLPQAGTSYTWELNGAGTITPNNLSVTIPADGVSRTVRLLGSNACFTNELIDQLSYGGGAPVPVTPSPVSGPSTINFNSVGTYSVGAQPVGVNFSWDAGTDATITAGASGNIKNIQWSTGGLKTIYVIASNTCGSPPFRSYNVFVNGPCVAPSVPGTISGESTVCAGVEYQYAVPFQNFDTFNWSAGADATITGSGSIRTIKWSTGGAKTISVTATNLCTTSTARTLAVTVNPIPSQPATLTGSTSGCNGATQQISLASPIAGVTYTWEVQGGNVVTSGAQGQIANITWTSLGVNQVKLKPSNACGNGTPRILDVTVGTVPDQPSFISGEGEVCSATSKTYSVTNTSGVTYAWNAGSGGTVTGSGNSVSISWSTTGAKTITVTPSNSCGNGTARTLTVNVGGVPAQPVAIAGLASPTLGNEEAYSVTSVAGINYTWSLSDKGTLSASGNSASVFWNTPGSATLSVTPSNTCGNGTARIAPITVNKISQTITFTVTSPMLANQALTLNGSASSGLPIAYTSSNTSIAEILGSELIIKGAGTINLTASQPGDVTFAAATPVIRSLTINKANQNITFDPLIATTFGQGDIQLEGASNSGLPISYSSSNNSLAIVSGNTINIVGAGTANITAIQGGDAIYNAATPVVRALTVNKADQAIEFEPLVAKGITDPPFSLSATTTSGLTVTYTSSNAAVATVSGNTVTIIGQGTSTITATQSGNVNYNAATSVGRSLTINAKQSQSITFGALLAKTFGDADFLVSATASSGLAVSYSSSNTSVATVSGSTVTIVGAGSTEITASQPGDATYNPATSVQQTLVVDKANQTISFAVLTSRQLSEGSFEIVATATSGLMLSFTSSNPGVASVSGSQVTLIAEGTTEITAAQPGNDNFNAASDVVQTLTILNFVPTRIISMVSAMEFGSQIFPGTLSKNLTIENTGNSELTIKSITFPDGYTGNKASGIIGSGESLVVEVTFAPTASKDYSGNVEVVSNATSGTGAVDVSGKGVLVTALEDTFGLSNIKVFPNPSEGVYTIQGGEVEARQARITDEFGRKVMIVDLQSIQSGQYQLDISDLSQGVYFLHLASKQPRVIRLVKVN